MNISIIGIGYVGGALARLFARKHQVRVFDIDPSKTKSLPEGIIACETVGEAIRGADYILVAVPTDYDEKTHCFDTSNVDNVLQAIEEHAPHATAVIKSTIPVGYMEQADSKYRIDALFFSPEFLRETSALKDCLHPSRIIVGHRGQKEKAAEFAEIMKELADEKDIPILLTGYREAEAIKLFSNTYLALRVSYFNELDTFAMLHHMDAADIIQGVCYDPRIGQGYNNPSFGYGGYCLPKDTKQLLNNFSSVPQNLIEAIVRSNDTRKKAVAERIVEEAKRRSPSPTIGIYRLVMKQGSDNFRQSAVIDLLALLLAADLKVQIYEPKIDADIFQGVPVCHTLDSFLSSSTLIVANRLDGNLKDVLGKVFTRDLFHEE